MVVTSLLLEKVIYLVPRLYGFRFVGLHEGFDGAVREMNADQHYR